MSNGKFNAQNRAQMLETTLGLLKAIEEDESLTQRSLAVRLGVALGLTNTLLKRCVKKGLLKVSEAPARRFIYYLTPKGFSEKSKLTAEYLSHSLRFFREVREQYDDIFAACHKQGIQKVALYGAGELAEIASLAAAASGVQLIAVIDPKQNTDEFCGLPVQSSISALGEEELDVVVMTATTETQESYIHLLEQLGPLRVFAPELMHVVSPGEQADGDGGAV